MFIMFFYEEYFYKVKTTCFHIFVTSTAFSIFLVAVQDFQSQQDV